MSGKPIHNLNSEQARELKWFCKNVSGVRQEMYSTIELVNKFDDKIKRLEKTCALIESFLSEKIEPHKSIKTQDEKVDE